MGFSPLANTSRRIPDVGRSSPRNTAITGFTIHHNAGIDAFGQATAPGREVSANYWITNAGVILPNVDEDRRAWTSGAAGYPAGAAADHRNVTVEVSNSPEGVRSGSWAISEAAETALARLIGDVYRRHGLGKVTRGANRGVGAHRDWVPTVCPGPYIMAHLGRIITAAEQYRTGGTPAKKGLTVLHYARKDANPGRTLTPGKHCYLHTTKGARASQASNVVGGIGPYSITTHLYAEGTPGDAVDLMLMWQKGGNSFHYRHRAVFDENGRIYDNAEFKRAVPAGYRVFARAETPATNKGSAKVTLLATDAYLIK